MKIVVPVKQVAALDDEFEVTAEDGSVDPDSIDWEQNEWDAFSLEAAIQLREAAGDGEVVAVSVGDEVADDGLRAALAKGVDRAVRVWDDALEGADALVVARVLAAIVEREGPDLVLCGVQSSDAVNSATGIALAGFLSMPHVAVVKGIESDGSTLALQRELEGGLVELLRISTPALLTIQTGINEPRYANLRAIKQARAKPLDVYSPAEIGLDSDALEAAAGSRRRRLVAPDHGEGAEMLDGTASDVADRIATIVKERLN
jgi:electron transfer flavoprotein beta subunit